MQNVESRGECEMCSADKRAVSEFATKLQPGGVIPALYSFFIVSDDQVLCDALVDMLGAECRASRCVVSDFFPAAMQTIDSSRMRVLVLDAAALSRATCARVRDLRVAAPDLRILLINMAPDESAFGEIAQLNLEGYLLRDAALPEIVAALNAVIHGAAVCPPELLRTLLQQTRITEPLDSVGSHPISLTLNSAPS